jgi:protein-S-isoprenylcysteine O-methyltransferase Ste14
MTQGAATSPASASTPVPSPPEATSGTRSFRDLLFRLRGWGVIALGAVVVAWQWPLRPQLWLVLAALPIVVLGVFFRVWARCYFTRGSDTRRIQAHRLVLLGPYRRVRNPLYVGNMAVAVGLALAYAGPWAALAFLVALFVLYSGVIRSEEEILAKSHGDAYAEFRRVVPRWIPRLRPLPADPDAPPPALRHALKKEAERMAGALAAWGLALGLALMVR